MGWKNIQRSSGISGSLAGTERKYCLVQKNWKHNCQVYENQEIPQEAIVMEKRVVRLMRPAMIREYLRDNPLLSMESKILMLNKMLYDPL